MPGKFHDYLLFFIVLCLLSMDFLFLSPLPAALLHRNTNFPPSILNFSLLLASYTVYQLESVTMCFIHDTKGFPLNVVLHGKNTFNIQRMA
jgi:hypothetical protein